MKNTVTVIRNLINGFNRQLDAGTNSISEQKYIAGKYMQKKHHKEISL